jgi:sortase A
MVRKMELVLKEANTLVRKIAILMILLGGIILIYNGFQWWDQLRVVVRDPKLAMAVADDWNDTRTQPTLEKGIESEWNPERGDLIGELIIPRIGAILPIVYGTGDEELDKGVGQYIGYGTVLPGQTGHSVLAGHRETVFRRAGEIEEGDRLYIKMNGYTHTYQVRKHWIVDENDRSVIVPLPEPALTLITCYPFNLVGSAPERYIIRAELIESVEDPNQTTVHELTTNVQP